MPFQEDVEQIIALIEEHYKVVETERKSEGLSYREFAYDSVHLIIKVDTRDGLVFPRGCQKVVEIQIRTILQDAWAEVEHELIYKSSVEYPNEMIRKKMAALNANLTLSDIIFQEIRDHQKSMVVWGKERFTELKKKVEQIDPESIPPYRKKNPKVVNKKQKFGLTQIDARKLEDTFQKGLEAHNKKEYKRAISFYSRAMQLNPDLKILSILYNHRGLALFMMDEEEKALDDFNKSFQCNTHNYRALNNRALVLRRLGETIEAIKDFNLSLSIKEEQADVYYLRAQTYYEIKDFKDAQLDLKRAIDIYPPYDEAKKLLKIIKKM